MTYTEKERDQFLHGISLSLLSKKSAQHWRYDEETAKEIEWLEALERKVRADKADRKTEPTCSKMEQVDKDINVRSKDEPTTEDCSTVWTKENCKGCKYNEYPYDSGTCFVRVCINGNKYEPKDEQTERSV